MDDEEDVLFIRFAFENPYYTKVPAVVTGQVKQCQTRCDLVVILDYRAQTVALFYLVTTTGT